MKPVLPFTVLLVALLSAAPAAARDELCDTRYQDCRAPLLQLINNEPAGGGIDVAFWFMEDGRYSDALIRAFNRGVRVRVLVDVRANDSKRLNAEILTALANAGVPMRTKVALNWSDILHWKMMYFATPNVLQFSAANYTPYSFVPSVPYSDYIDEVVYFTDDRRLTGSFTTRFEDYWTDQSGNFRDHANVSGPQPRVYPTVPIDPSLNFPPHQDYALRALSHYRNEIGLPGGKIDVIMFRHSDRRHADAMINAFRNGVPVRVITEQENYRHPSFIWHSHNTDLMWAAGIAVKDRAHAGSMHQKSVILYGQREVIFGSSNWSTASANIQLEHNIFSRPCSPGQTTWCDGGANGPNWFFNYFVAQFESKWNSNEFKTFVPLPGGTPVNSAPAHGATGMATSGLALRWDGGNWNHKYDVYLGRSSNLTAADKIASDIIVGSPYTGDWETWTIPGTLEPGTTYYWRVVGKTMADGPRAAAAGLDLAKPGPVWSFRTAGTPSDGGGGGPLAPFGGTAVALPGRIQAENFDEGGAGVAYFDTTSGNNGGAYRTTDVDIGPVTGGGYYVGWTRPGEWLKYSVNVPTAGTYTLELRVANRGTGARVRVEVDGVDRTGSITIPDTGDWQAWRIISRSGISLTAGAHVVRLVYEAGTAENGGVGNVDYLGFTASSSGATPFGGTAVSLPGRIQAENFDEGGTGVAYVDTTSGNTGGVYRTTDVDIGPVTGGGYYVGWTRPGEWLRYSVNVPTAGTYTLELRVANRGTGARVRVEVDGVDRTGSIAIPDTGDWQAWRTISRSGISLTAGAHVVALVFEAGTAENGGVGNVDYLGFTGSSSGATPYGGTAAAVPGVIEAENFDEGGAGVAYADTTAGNNGNVYRTTDVDIAPASDTGGGYYVGWTRPGEWLRYTVNVAAAGTYTLDVRVANRGTGATFHVEVDGVDRTGPLTMPDTGDWQAWQTISTPGIELAAGTRVVRLVLDAPTSQNGGVGNFNYLRFR